ncbi:MAG: M23 family metallopeptidase [Elusimicrobia bacterium]|nr:M23 family metallopeptidase [Elusimicrobiota bacterium]
MKKVLFFLLFFGIFSCGKKNIQKPAEIFHGGSITAGDTLIGIFSSNGIAANSYIPVITKFKTIFNVRNIRPGDYYEVVTTTSGVIKSFVFSNTPEVKYKVWLTTTGYKAKKTKLKLYKRIKGYSGTIRGNLYNSMLSAGVNPSLIMNFADIFESHIDFLTDPRPGDRFEIIYEKFYTEEGQELDRGNIIVAKYFMKKEKREFTAFAYPLGSGYDYFTPSGMSLRTQFLRAPLHYRRISSYFSLRRLHPILKYYRPHYGIDYAAPIGTPVSAVADGVVVKKGFSRDGGRYIKLKHKNNYTTFYAHLSRYARGMKKGKRVYKGQVIAYVGSSGLSTGPHLYFRIKKYGKPLNFLKMKLPPKQKLNRREMKKFRKLKKKYYTYLAKLRQKGKLSINDSY